MHWRWAYLFYGLACKVPPGARHREAWSKRSDLLLVHTPSFDLDSEVFVDEI